MNLMNARTFTPTFWTHQFLQQIAFHITTLWACYYSKFNITSNGNQTSQWRVLNYIASYPRHFLRFRRFFHISFEALIQKIVHKSRLPVSCPLQASSHLGLTIQTPYRCCEYRITVTLHSWIAMWLHHCIRRLIITLNNGIIICKEFYW